MALGRRGSLQSSLVLLPFVLALSSRAHAQVVCEGVSPEGITVWVRLDDPVGGTVVTTTPPCDGAVVVGGAATSDGSWPPFDLYLVVDSSGSTARCSGIDLDDDLLVGADLPSGCSDLDDSVLAAELEALRGLLDSVEGLGARAAVIEFSAVLPNPGPGEQGRIRVVRPLTSDLDAARAGLGEILAAGPRGATDYAGALDAAIGELRASGDPSRQSLAFFLTDGKPTFPRYPFDSTENMDVVASLAAGHRAAAAGLAVNTYEIGSFDDRGTLAEIASITGGRAVSALDALSLLQLLPITRLTGISSVVVVNDTTGESVSADVEADGSFSATVPLAPDYNVLHVEVTAEGGTPFLLECATSVLHECVEEGLCFRETTDVLLRELLATSDELARELGLASSCDALRGAGTSACADAAREYLALALNVLDGRLTSQCRVDLGPGQPVTAEGVLDLTRALIAAGDCAEAARLAREVSSGAAVVEEPLATPQAVECVIEDPDTGLDVTLTITSPVIGDGAAREPCDGVVPVVGRAELSGLSNLFDLFFVIDSSGSTSAASGRDIDGDGFLGTGPSYANTDPGDSVLEAELEAVRQFVGDLDPAWARVAIIQFSNPEGTFGGERQRIVQSLTDDFVLVQAALRAVSFGGSEGATDYGGALDLLEIEYLANADPANRIPICFFLSDGIPTWPDPPFNETQPRDRQTALDGARDARRNGITINTYEVGPAGAADILTQIADMTGGQFYASTVAGDIVDVLNQFNLVGIASVRIENVTTGESSAAAVAADGSFTGVVGLQPGMNEVRVWITTDSQDPVTASCVSPVELVFANLLCQPLNASTWAAECARPVVPTASIPVVRAAPSDGDGVLIVIDPVPLGDGHRIYRGDLELLRAGTYSHVSPFSADAAQPECLLPPTQTTFTDRGALRDGRDWYYLVAAVVGGVESSHGFADRDADGRGDVERPRPADSPTDLVLNSCP